MKDPDFAIQGEYLGEGQWAGSDRAKVDAQVIALGKGQFTAVLTKGGLPGDGWRRGDPRWLLTGKRSGDTTALSGKDLSGKIVGETMTIAGGGKQLELKRTVRHSADRRREAARRRRGAVRRHDRRELCSRELLPDRNLCPKPPPSKVSATMRCTWSSALYMPESRGQDRSNSGVYLHDCYEVQVLDSFGLEGKDDECGGFYKLRTPDVNMCLPPLTWQTYDANFTAPRYKDGKKVANARVEVRHNGVLIHPEFELSHATPGRQGEGPAPRPFYLQGHGNKVEFRNIWVKRRNDPRLILLSWAHPPARHRLEVGL